MRYVPKHEAGIVYYTECDWCGLFHPEGWDGQCHEDESVRFTIDQLDTKHGKEGWLPDCFAELELVPDEEEQPKLKAA